MFKYLRTTLHPDSYHGHSKQGPFFEGWYFKLVDAQETEGWVIIPGIYIGVDPADTHAFIQVMNGTTGHSIYQTYEPTNFWADDGKFDVRIRNNHFSASQIHLDVNHPDIQIHGELSFQSVTPWPVTLFSPGIMGWYGWIPFMECYHGVVSLHHTLLGTLEINGKHLDLTGGTGYIEKDWGKSFPKAWIWMQSNHFSHPRTCLTASAAIIPWGQHSFNGFIAGLWIEDHLYRFATYTGAHLEEYHVSDHEAWMILVDHSYRLELTARRAEGGILQAPTTTQMNRRITETLSACIQVKLTKRKSGRWQTIFSDEGKWAGLEVVGKLD